MTKDKAEKMTDAERESERIARWIGKQYGLKLDTLIGKLEILQALQQAEQRGREQGLIKCTCTDNKFDCICDYCFLQSARRLENEVYRKGLLRAVEIINIGSNDGSLDEIVKEIEAEAEGGSHGE